MVPWLIPSSSHWGKVGESLSEPDFIETAKSALAKAEEKGVKFLIPVDNLGVKDLDFGAGTVGETNF